MQQKTIEQIFPTWWRLNMKNPLLKAVIQSGSEAAIKAGAEELLKIIDSDFYHADTDEARRLRDICRQRALLRYFIGEMAIKVMNDTADGNAIMDEIKRNIAENLEKAKDEEWLTRHIQQELKEAGKEL